MKNYKSLLLIVIFLLTFSFQNSAQTIHVDLKQLTSIDDQDYHVIVFKSEPLTRLKLPEIDIKRAKFFNVFYSWDNKSDPEIDIMLIPQENFDKLFIDLNNDEDLTNDGSPFIFPVDQDSLCFDITSDADFHQRIKLAFFRKPQTTDSFASKLIDQNGNLDLKVARIFGASQGIFNYQGEKGTFYFDARITLRRGYLQLGDESILIGLFDYTNNGLYNDNEDILIIDLGGDGKLEYDNIQEVFKLNDVFTLNGQNYKIHRLDKYGTWVEFIRAAAEEEATFYFFKEQQNLKTNLAKTHTVDGELDQSFWDLSFKALDGKELRMNRLKGKFVLLNFWGEWCRPCINEIPDLIECYQKISGNQFEIISFAKSTKTDLLQKIISEKQMDWTHILLPESIIEKFKISGYPTNILILKDGKSFLRTGEITYNFISTYIQ